MGKGKHRFYDGLKPVRQPLANFLATKEVASKQHADPNDADQSTNDLTTPIQQVVRDTVDRAIQNVLATVAVKKEATIKKSEPKKPLTIQQQTTARVNGFNSIWKKHSNEDRTNADVRPGISFGNK